MLTKKMRELLLLIHERTKDGDVPPSFDEMKDALGLKSKSGIHRLITALVERGYIERLPHRARALQIKKLPEGYRPPETDVTSAASKARAINDVYRAANTESVPLYGKIAAGTPIEAIRDEGRSVDIPATILTRGRHYALTVEGDSMIKAGIHDGDTVIIRETESVHPGDIAVALVEDQEVTLKRIRFAGTKIVLEPENDAYEPRVLNPDQVRFQGILAGLYRLYH